MFEEIIKDKIGDCDIRSFSSLTVDDLYEILRARADVFVGEEKILYPDADGIDRHCLHVYAKKEDGTVSSYLRIYEKEDEKHTMQFGRVLTRIHGHGEGMKLLSAAIKAVRKYTDAEEIYIESQQHAVGFYMKAGFVQTSGEFIEAGIPHVRMRLKLN